MNVKAHPRLCDDFSQDRLTIHVTKAWKRGETSGRRYLGSPKTRRGVRDITIPQTLADRIAPYLDHADPWLWHAPTDPSVPMHPNHFRSRQWVKAVSDFHPRPRIHDLRHSHASALIGAGVPLPVIQARLGHESIQTTIDIYGHIMPEQQKNAADVFSGI